MNLVETDIAGLQSALERGETTSVALVAEYLRRMAAYDRSGTRLNAVPVLNPNAFAEARASDVRRAQGRLLSPLDGIPYTVKDSYQVEGMAVAAGSPAFAGLRASEDAFSVAVLRAGGAVLLGLTNMPPMANGGMQRGVYGRAESPYNAAFLTSAWASGSSNGSGTATAAAFAAFGLGEETWSSGRAPANNNGLCAYTPSWGVISMRGNWPLVPTMDVVVPHTRTMADMLAVLDVLVQDDARPRGDFWRMQDAVAIAPSSQMRPASYLDLLPEADGKQPLAGWRIGMPSMYLGRPQAGETEVPTRASAAALAQRAADDLRALGAEVEECGFPLMAQYEGRFAVRGGAYQGGLEEAGYLPRGFAHTELAELCTFALDDFIRANAEAAAEPPAIRCLADAAPDLVFPQPPGQIADEYGEAFGMGEYVRFARSGAVKPLHGIGRLREGLAGLDRARRELLERWMDERGYDVLAFPTCADIAPADADTNPASHDVAWRNGTWVANGNLAIRHLGIPTVTVPMGMAADIAMPFGLTFAGRGWDDTRLLRAAAVFDAGKVRRTAPPRTPELPPLHAHAAAAVPSAVSGGLELAAETAADAQGLLLTVRAAADPQLGSLLRATVSVNGRAVEAVPHEGGFSARCRLDPADFAVFHSHWRPAYGALVVAVAECEGGSAGAYCSVNGV